MSRLFLAQRVVKLERYDRLQEEASTCLEGRWVSPENLHLTLRFLGDTLSVAEVRERLQGFSPQPASMELSGLGCFERNGILYAGVEPEKAARESSEAVCSRLGVAPLQVYTPHVTLMRVKKILDEACFGRLVETWSDLHGSIGHEVVLIESKLGPEGARYTVLERYGSC
jgi:2'-5' RNA ligase